MGLHIYRLAQIALTSGMKQIWHYNFPLSVMDVVCAEQVHVSN
jgi:hypothetical protein